jgi:hypothetical protein
MDGADDFVLGRSERRIERDHAVAIEDLDLLSVLFKQPHLRDAAIKGRLAAVKVQNAARVAIIFNRLFGDDLGKHRLRIGGETMLQQSVAARLGRGAFHQEQPGPRVEARVGGQSEAQRLILQRQRF